MLHIMHIGDQTKHHNHIYNQTNQKPQKQIEKDCIWAKVPNSLEPKQGPSSYQCPVSADFVEQSLFVAWLKCCGPELQRGLQV